MQHDTPHILRMSDRRRLNPAISPPRTHGSAGDTSAEDLEQLARWLDSVFEIPGVRVRFGVDALLGLLPAVGDTASALASVYILNAATRIGLPRITVARMTLNILVDLLIGAIPIFGDFFDIYWKANQKNVALLRRHLNSTPQIERSEKRSDALFVAAMVACIFGALAASVAVTYYFIAWVFRMLS